MIDLTPLEVRKKKGDFRRVMRGYEAQAVDDFLDLVADRLEQLVRENLALHERIAASDAHVSDFRERERALTEALVTAQEMREEMRKQMEREAELMRREAEAEADAVRGGAVQTREREEENIRRLRARQSQFVQSYRGFLERELAELSVIAETLEFGAAGDEEAAAAVQRRARRAEPRADQPASAAAFVAQPEPIRKPAVEPQPKVEPPRKLELQPRVDAQPKLEPQPKVELQPGVEPRPKVQPQSRVEGQPTIPSQPFRTETQPRVELPPKVELQRKIEPEPRVEPKPEPALKSELKSKSDLGTGSEPNPKPASESSPPAQAESLTAPKRPVTPAPAPQLPPVGDRLDIGADFEMELIKLPIDDPDFGAPPAEEEPELELIDEVTAEDETDGWVSSLLEGKGD